MEPEVWVADVVMRRFGNAVSLDLDFTQADRPALVTELLSQCSEQSDPAFWWTQPVSRRTAALLRIVALTENRNDLSLSGRCAAVSCGESFEFELPLASVSDSAASPGALQVQLGDDRILTMRLPTGEDLRQWRVAQPRSRGEAVRLMLDSLVLTGHAAVEDEAAISASIAAIDPLVAFTVSCQCPACGTPAEVEVDLETLALASLVRRQRTLLSVVHRFASHYGWTESEVLAIPAARRARYLALIEDER